MEVGDVGETMLTKDEFASAEFRVQAAQRTVGEVGVEVRDHADHVGQTNERVEGGATLVVDEHHRQPVRSAVDGQSGDEGAQQFALP